jgi:L-lactate dehydrogenase complex protein LldF
MNPIPVETLQKALGNEGLVEAIYTSTGRLMDKRAGSIPDGMQDDFQAWREQAHQIKKHTIENLDHYIEQAEEQVTARGGKVIYARDGGEVAQFIINLAKERGSELIVKSKSMTTEEIDLNEWLEKDELETVETDLGEYIIQLAKERPSHIVAPALHKTRYQVADLFTEKLGVEREEVPEKQTLIARRVLREKFLAADIGITGANYVIAESGSVAVIENEGNARLCSSAPKIHIAIAGIEKLIPRAQDLAIFLKLLGRSATGQPLTVYTSFLSGPRREGEVDGPDEFYLVLLDNGRTKLLEDKAKRESLYCIRCGACLNHCPVYRKVGGHSYPWVYSGPIGAIITPQFKGISEDPWLPFASSLCGACAEVCPVKINIPQILLDLRSEAVKAKQRADEAKLERLGFRLWAWVMTHPKLYAAAALFSGALGGDEPVWQNSVPAPFNVGPLKAWMSQRDLPPAPSHTFRQLWEGRANGSAKREKES